MDFNEVHKKFDTIRNKISHKFHQNFIETIKIFAHGLQRSSCEFSYKIR